MLRAICENACIYGTVTSMRLELPGLAIPYAAALAAHSQEQRTSLDELRKQAHPEVTQDLPVETSERRTIEFLLGRAAAHEALQLLGCSAAVRKRHPTDRVPVWPDPFVGSIAHTSSFEGALGIAVVAPADYAGGIGIDIEHRSRVVHPKLARRIATSREQRDLLRHKPTSEDLLILFSAKESLYKAYAKHARGRPLTFHDACLELQRESQCFVGSLRCGSRTLEVKASYRFYQHLLITWAVMPSP